MYYFDHGIISLEWIVGHSLNPSNLFHNWRWLIKSMVKLFLNQWMILFHVIDQMKLLRYLRQKKPDSSGSTKAVRVNKDCNWLIFQKMTTNRNTSPSTQNHRAIIPTTPNVQSESGKEKDNKNENNKKNKDTTRRVAEIATSEQRPKTIPSIAMQCDLIHLSQGLLWLVFRCNFSYLRSISFLLFILANNSLDLTLQTIENETPQFVRHKSEMIIIIAIIVLIHSWLFNNWHQIRTLIWSYIDHLLAHWTDLITAFRATFKFKLSRITLPIIIKLDADLKGLWKRGR